MHFRFSLEIQATAEWRYLTGAGLIDAPLSDINLSVKIREDLIGYGTMEGSSECNNNNASFPLPTMQESDANPNQGAVNSSDWRWSNNTRGVKRRAESGHSSGNGDLESEGWCPSAKTARREPGIAAGTVVESQIDVNCGESEEKVSSRMEFLRDMFEEDVEMQDDGDVNDPIQIGRTEASGSKGMTRDLGKHWWEAQVTLSDEIQSALRSGSELCHLSNDILLKPLLVSEDLAKEVSSAVVMWKSSPVFPGQVMVRDIEEGPEETGNLEARKGVIKSTGDDNNNIRKWYTRLVGQDSVLMRELEDLRRVHPILSVNKLDDDVEMDL